MKPKPFVALNHLTVPVVILTSPGGAHALLCPHDLRAGLNPISAMSWGSEPVRRDQQGKSIIRMGGVYIATPDIASDKPIRTKYPERSPRKLRAGSAEPADLFLGHHPLDVLGLALDAV